MILKIIAVGMSYLIGNFSTSLIISKFLANIDIRNYGSGNAGTTNMYRILGAKAATITLIGDALKGALAVWIGSKLGGENTALVCGVAVIAGHNWPVFFGFKGGKGIATTIGVGLFLNYFAGMICILMGILVLIKTRYVSLTSIIGITLLPILLLFDNGFKYFLFGLILAAMALYRHKENIERLLRGTESKIK